MAEEVQGTRAAVTSFIGVSRQWLEGGVAGYYMRDPLYLYKYRPLSPDETRDRVEEIFTCNRLYFAAPSDFNDPFEFRLSALFDGPTAVRLNWLTQRLQQSNPGLSADAVRERASEYLVRLAGRPEQEWQDRFWDLIDAEGRRKVGVLSLSERNDDIRMWSHYADSHRGICIEFEATKNTLFFSRAQPVVYREEFPVVDICRASHEEKMLALCLTKARDWEYEKEWRIVDPWKGPGVQEFPPDLLTGVILGLRIPAEHRELVLGWARARNGTVRVYEARERPNSYALAIVPVE